ncbi:unnamed protein product, partial [Polarella glacialis]
EDSSKSVAASTANLHLLSWNVAGWKTSVEQIRRFAGGLEAFVQRHQADVLCLQEVKLASKVLATDGKQLGADLAGYDSFWACNEGSGAQRQGLNGVATFARKGTVLRADSAPLGSPELDGEGRCLLTDHGAFVLFNVYVPNSSSGSRLHFKLRWLNALRASMQKERAAGKAVIVAGDLNMKSRLQDVHWSWRPVRASCLKSVREGAPEDLEPEVHTQLLAVAAVWDQLLQALRAKEHRPIETRNPRSGQVFQKWGIYARPFRPGGGPPLGGDEAENAEFVRLGPPVDSEDSARGSFLVDGMGVEADGEIVLGAAALSATFLLREPGELCLGDLAEGLRKLAGIELSSKAVQWLAARATGPGTPPPVRDWLEAVLREDGMVDSFAELYPTAEERFTCWDQYRNKRHDNEGSRIDYVLVDRSFFAQYAVRGAGLDAQRHPRPECAAAALAAAKLGGLSQPSPFAGGGMPELFQDEYFAQFRADSEGPSTGMVYTPPQLSDHIAVTLLLQALPCQGQIHCDGSAPRDPATARCQPHRSTRRITDFFGARKAAVPGPMPPGKRRALGAG